MGSDAARAVPAASLPSALVASWSGRSAPVETAEHTAGIDGVR